MLSPSFTKSFLVHSKLTPKKAPSFASQKGSINIDNFNINQLNEKQDNEDSSDEPPENENQPNIDNKEEVSEDHQVFGVFVNEENDHKRNRPLRALSDDDGFMNSDYSDDMNLSSDFSFGEVKKLDNNMQHSAENSVNITSEDSYFDKSFTTSTITTTNSTNNNLFTPIRGNKNDYGQNVSIMYLTPGNTPTKRRNETYLRSPNKRSQFQDECAQFATERKRIQKHKFLYDDDELDDEWMVTPKKTEQEVPNTITIPEAVEIVGPKYIEKDQRDVLFVPPKHVRPKPSPRKSPRKTPIKDSPFSTPKKQSLTPRK